MFRDGFVGVFGAGGRIAAEASREGREGDAIDEDQRARGASGEGSQRGREGRHKHNLFPSDANLKGARYISRGLSETAAQEELGKIVCLGNWAGMHQSDSR